MSHIWVVLSCSCCSMLNNGGSCRTNLHWTHRISLVLLQLLLLMDVFLYFHGLHCRTDALENESQHSSIDTSTDKPLNSIKHHLTVRTAWPWIHEPLWRKALIPIVCVCGSEDHISTIKLFNVDRVFNDSDNSEVYVSDQWTLYRLLQKRDSFRCPERFLGRDFSRWPSFMILCVYLWVYALQYILYVSYTFGPAVVL